ncbi:MAG: amidohydrolase family protein [Euryarchaeota archaeon]|nr:amidohydrolase family protein [Euryarchaeota archaeon]
MIIDAHNHVGGPDKGDYAKQSAEEIVTVMDRLGIDKAVIFPFNELEPGISFSLANDRTAQSVQKYPDRLIGFARLDPNYKERAVEELERSIKKLGLKGLKLHPTSQNFSLDDPYVLKIIEKTAELKIPVVFDSGKTLSLPEYIGKLAEQVPDSTIIMAHMRGPNYLEVAKKFDNIFLGTTGMFAIDKLQKALNTLGAEKLIVGSDSPYIKMEQELKKIDLIPNIKEEEKGLISGENMRKILKI